MIILENVKKSFGDNIIYDNFNLTINDGEMVALIGESGCGKSTLLNMIGAIESIDSGIITVDNIDITKKKNHMQYFQTKVGFIFQNFALIENQTVRKNLEIVKPKFRSNLTIEQSLKEVDLLNKIDCKVCTLSGGQQQKVALARLMLKKCSLVLADEPTGSLDEKNAAIVFEILKKLNKEYNKTVIIVTHNNSIANKCTRVINISEI